MISADQIAAIKDLGQALRMLEIGMTWKPSGLLFTPTVDFVVVTGAWFGGQENGVRYHARASRYEFQGQHMEDDRRGGQTFDPGHLLSPCALGHFR